MKQIDEEELIKSLIILVFGLIWLPLGILDVIPSIIGVVVSSAALLYKIIKHLNDTYDIKRKNTKFHH